MPNRLAHETSPYLLQHQDNPVDWYPWGTEAFETARAGDKPILLSVGYSACHWCHVMAHESFEDPATAAVMNELFVNVKVDREERPDVDGIYMNAVQAMTGRGGWPMTVWLNHDKAPFYAGTYFPPTDRHGMPSFRRVMEAVHDAWVHRRAGVTEQAEKMAAAIDRQIPAGEAIPGQAILEQAYLQLAASYDDRNGGMGGAPKFPQDPVLEFLLRVREEPWAPGATRMVLGTLTRMAEGGLYDHLGGGFARYSVDARWEIPHFEKMLYNNAQLARLYIRASQALESEAAAAAGGGPPIGREALESLRAVGVETLEYLLRDMTHPDGGWYSAEDADSEGEEGKFYVFAFDEFNEIVGPTAAVAAAFWGVTEGGNFEGANHLRLAAGAGEVAERFGIGPDEVRRIVADAKEKLLAVRDRRIRPGLDDKVVTAWNGLALRAFAEAGAILGEPRYLDAGRNNARFVLDHLVVEGRLMRSWGKGKAQVSGFLDDYAGYALGLFSLYMATGDVEWYAAAERLVRQMIDLFWEDGWFQTAGDAERLLTRPKDQMDNPSPSGASMAAEAVLWLSLYTGDSHLRDLAESALREAAPLVEHYPSAVGHLMAVVHSLHQGYREVAVIGPDAGRLAATVWQGFRPNLVLAVDESGRDGSVVPLLDGRWTGDTLAYVCEGFVCQRPVRDSEELASLL